MAEDAPSGFLDYDLSLPLRGILRSTLAMTKDGWCFEDRVARAHSCPCFGIPSRKQSTGKSAGATKACHSEALGSSSAALRSIQDGAGNSSLWNHTTKTIGLV